MLNNNGFFDADSIQILIRTRPSYDATSNYSIDIAIYDGFDNSTLMSPKTLQWSISPKNNLPNYSPLVKNK